MWEAQNGENSISHSLPVAPGEKPSAFGQVDSSAPDLRAELPPEFRHLIQHHCLVRLGRFQGPGLVQRGGNGGGWGGSRGEGGGEVGGKLW